MVNHRFRCADCTGTVANRAGAVACARANYRRPGACEIAFDTGRLALRWPQQRPDSAGRAFCLATSRDRLRYCLRADSFHAVGGYPEQPLMEDLEIIKQLRTIGKVVLLPHYVITSARRHEKVGLLRSVLFMWYLRLLYKFGVSPAQLQRMYFDVR